MIAIASDHGGFELKKNIMQYLDKKSIEYRDYGTFSAESCDYPKYAYIAASAVASGECEKGILFCGTGVGISVAANKVKGIRCVVCTEPFSAILSRRHNDANMLALGGRVVGPDLAVMIVESWLNESFEGGRHGRRVGMISAIERGEKVE